MLKVESFNTRGAAMDNAEWKKLWEAMCGRDTVESCEAYQRLMNQALHHLETHYPPEDATAACEEWSRLILNHYV